MDLEKLQKNNDFAFPEVRTQDLLCVRQAW